MLFSFWFQIGSRSLENLPTLQVGSINDLLPGDVIRFRYKKLPHEAVPVKLAEAEIVTVDVIYYNLKSIWNQTSCGRNNNI